MTTTDMTHSKNQKFICGDVIIWGDGAVQTIEKIRDDVVEFDGSAIPIETLKNNNRTGTCMWISKADNKGTVRHMLKFINKRIK